MKGYFTTVHRQKDEVVKMLPNTIKQKQIDYFKKAHESYIQLLTEAKVNIPATRIEFWQEKKKIRPVITQSAFNEEELLDSIIRKAPKSEALKAFEKMLNLNFKVIKFNEKRKLKVGFDGSPRNLAMHDNKIYYYDTFPPYLKDKYQKGIIRSQIKTGLKTLATMAAPVILKQFYDPSKMIRSAVRSSIKRRPELEENFKKIAKLIVLNNVPESQAKPYLKFKPSLTSRMISRLRKSRG